MKLAPEIVEMRDALLERIGEKPLSEVSQIVNEILLNETNHVNRLAALAARVKILKDKIKNNFDIQNHGGKKKISQSLAKKLEKNEEDSNNKSQKQIENNDSDNWTRVEMVKSGIVNGVRFPSGVVIDVSQSDADKLVADGLSKIVKNTEDPKPAAEEVAATTETSEDPKPAAEEVAATTETSEDPKPAAEDIKKEIKPNVVTNNKNKEDLQNKKILKTKSTKITEETIELTDPKAVAEALGLNEAKKKAEEPKEIEEEIDFEALEKGKN
ncbi:MAG: hypothetical protein CMP24_02070 [Rickettsiales bacterium]|nr:hypothetical protein [Rickettsiales bacterium]